MPGTGQGNLGPRIVHLPKMLITTRMANRRTAIAPSRSRVVVSAERREVHVQLPTCTQAYMLELDPFPGFILCHHMDRSGCLSVHLLIVLGLLPNLASVNNAHRFL